MARAFTGRHKDITSLYDSLFSAEIRQKIMRMTKQSFETKGVLLIDFTEMKIGTLSGFPFKGEQNSIFGGANIQVGNQESTRTHTHME